MATDIKVLIGQARDVQQKLVTQGLVEEASVIEHLLDELSLLSPAVARPYYRAAEAAQIIGVTSQTVKNWVTRGMLQGYRLGGRIVIPRQAIDGYRHIAASLADLDPLPSQSELVEEIRRGRRPINWPSEQES